MKAKHRCRIIWSERLKTWIAVSVIARKRGKRRGRVFCLVLPLFMLSANAFGADAPTTVVPTGGQTTAYTSANGTPVVNINAANDAGLSHNQYTRFDVDSKGLVLNNGNLTQIQRSSQLAGSVLANPNLNREASVILNEVVSNNRSTLAGFIEVVGGKADVVIANPYGITCSGGGFINTDQVTLTTGMPQFRSNGALDGFTVNRGDILINGNGLNATGQQILNLVAHSIKVDGPINTSSTGTLRLVAGANTWNYGTGDVTGTGTATEVAPSYAIDSSALGGMYAGRIRLIATEAGIGVKMLGEAAASADDFTLDSAGRVVIQTKISANRDLNLTSSATGADAITATDSRISAKRNLGVSSTSGGLTLAGGIVSADGDIQYNVGTLTDTALATTTTLTNDNKRYAAGNFTINTSGTASFNGVTNGAGTTLSGNFASLTVGADGADLYGKTISFTTAGDMQFGTGVVHAVDDLNINATNGGSITNSGLLLAGNNAKVTAAGTISNDDKSAIVGLNALDVTSTSGNLKNAGMLYAGKSLNASSAQGTFINTDTGTIKSGGNMTLLADTFINNFWIEAAENIRIDAMTSFRNEMPGGLPIIVKDLSTLVPIASPDHSAKFIEKVPYYIEPWYDYVTVTDKFDPEPVKNVVVSAGHDLSIFGGTVANTGAALSAVNDMTILSPVNVTNTALTRYTRKFKREWYVVTTMFDSTPKIYALVDRSIFTSATKSPEWRLYTLVGGNGGYLQVDTVEEAQNVAILLETGIVVGLGVPVRNATIRSGNAFDVKGSVENIGPIFGTTETGNFDPSADKRAILPKNPYGYFIQTQDPSARCMIELNPLYGLGSDIEGSDRLLKNLGLDPETTLKRLGDANYEAYLIRQQLLSQTGKTVLNGPDSEKVQMTRFMDQAVGQSKELGLVVGKPLTVDQIANLKQDIVWMVETTVGDQKVLQPIVYLSPESRKEIVSGAVIAASEIKMDVQSLTNTGGTIRADKAVNITSQGDISNLSGTIKGGDVSLKSTEGSIVNQTRSETYGDKSNFQTVVGKTAGIESTGTLKITSQGDISNLSGTIKGGDVSLKSTEGRIVNQTLTETYGDKSNFQTVVGKTAGIESTGTLDLNAKKDILVKGAEVKAGGDASLTSGGNITFDTVVDKSATTTRTEGSGNFLYRTGPTTTLTTSEKNIGSTLSIGGNLKLKSGGDATLAGTKATVSGNLNVDTGGDFNILSRQDKTTIHSESSRSGLGVGGGLWGAQKTTSDDFTGKNFGSSLSVGGNADIKAGKDMTLQGSYLKIGGSGSIDAGSVNILQGLDEKHTVTRTDTTTFLSGGGKNDSHAGASASAGVGSVSAKANAGASAGASESHEFNLMESRTDTVDHSKKSGVSSNLTTGGNLSIKARDEMNVVGSNVEAGGDLNVDARKINVEAGKNEETTSTTSSSTKIGFYTDSKAEASAKADAGTEGASGTVNAEAKAEAGSTVTIGSRLQNSKEKTTEITHTKSGLKSGGNMSLKAKEEARFVGADVSAGGDLNIDAKDITNLSAQDSKISTSESTTHTMGVYLDASGSAEAKGSAKGEKGALSASGSASAKGEVGAGLRYAQENNTSEQGKTTNVVNTFKAGGNLSRKAAGTITDQGTQLEAGGNITQSATTLNEIAAEDKSWSSSSSGKHDARLGVYAGASVDAGASGNVISEGAEGKAKANADASAGISAKYTYEGSSESKSNTHVQTSKYKAGGSISSSTTGGTKLIGTQFEAGKDVSIEAGSLDYQAAHDTSSHSSTERSANAEAKVKVYGSSGVELGAGYDQKSSSGSSDAARAGSITAGGNVTVKTKDNARFEGTGVTAGEKAKIESTSGNVIFDAAKSTTHEESQSFNVNASFDSSKGASKSGKKGSGAESESNFGIGGGYSSSKSDKTTGTGVRINANNVDISAGKDVTMQGTQVEAEKKAEVTAGGKVNLQEAVQSESRSSIGVSANAKQSTKVKEDGGSEKTQKGGAKFNYDNEDKQKGQATSITSKGDLTIKGNNIINQEAELKAGGTRKIEGSETKQKLTNKDTGMNVKMSVEIQRKTKVEPKPKDEPKPKEESKPKEEPKVQDRPMLKK